MLNSFLDTALLFLQKIMLGGVFVLSFLGISVGEVATSTRPTFLTETNPPKSIEVLEKEGPEVEGETAEPKQAPPAIIPLETLPQTQVTVKAETAITPSPTTILPAPPPLIPQAELNEAARAAVVNIFCLTKTSGVFEPITGSGVVIDPQGVILTNAHVAQYLLLKDYKIPDFLNCVVRTGSPAIPLYKAELLYLPPIWIEENAPAIKLQKPTGTGENDFALLLITESTNTMRALPESFPAMSVYVGQNEIDVNDPVLLAAYPAGFLGGLNVTKNLWITSSVTSLKKLYTFRNQTLDGFSLGGTVLAQEGASGGGVFSLKTGELIGLIATSLLEGSTDERDLRAISLFHIDDSIKKYTGKDLQTFLYGDLKQKSAEFNNAIAPQLTAILTEVLEKK
ncbi:MAG: trypsin-like peptidase domain-containing protein [Parcubacteria group bacterium]|nr:trypsin-like peptidase domain-containing protein [Parcubacteria group bacterium]